MKKKSNPKITKEEKIVYADLVPIKTKTHKDLDDNFVLFRLPTEGFVVFPPNNYYLYLMDDETEAQKMQDGERGFPMFPIRRKWGAPDGFKMFWKHPDSTNVVGALHYEICDEDGEKFIYIRMMTVRKGYTRNGINSIMLEAISEKHKIKKFDFGYTTSSGEKFAKVMEKQGRRVRIKKEND